METVAYQDFYLMFSKGCYSLEAKFELSSQVEITFFYVELFLASSNFLEYKYL